MPKPDPDERMLRARHMCGIESPDSIILQSLRQSASPQLPDTATPEHRTGNTHWKCWADAVEPVADWAIVRTVVGYHRYDIDAELLLLNKIWVLQSQLTKYFGPQQKLISKVRDGAKVTKKYDVALTPCRRAEAHESVAKKTRTRLAETYTGINPAAVQRQIQALTTELLTLTTSKAGPARKAPVTRASTNESTNQSCRAS